MIRRVLTIAAVMAVIAVIACESSPPTPAYTSTVTRSEFEAAFPNHNNFYTYEGFASAAPANRRDAAAFMANIHHETGGLTIITEAPSRRSSYCDDSKAYGCPAGEDAYYGRGPIQLSWNYNYQTAGDVLSLDLLDNPSLIERDQTVAWRTTGWYWNTHVPSNADFGDTIRAINGPQECDGGNPAQVQSRVNAYLRITKLLGVSPGENLSC